MDELREALQRKGALLPEAELQRIMAMADVNGDGTIDYEEFVAATLYLGEQRAAGLGLAGAGGCSAGGAGGASAEAEVLAAVALPAAAGCCCRRLWRLRRCS